VGGHGFLETTVDVTHRLGVAADAVEPVFDVQVRWVNTLAIAVGVEQAASGKIFLGGRSDGINV